MNRRIAGTRTLGTDPDRKEAGFSTMKHSIPFVIIEIALTVDRRYPA